MKKDIVFPKVEDVAIAIIPDENAENNTWLVYLVNLKKKPLDTVLLVSKGYGNINGEKVTTSTLRHFFYQVRDRNYVKVELIEEKLTGLSNEFWLSFWCEGVMYDRKYVFVMESISRMNLTKVPVLEKQGVMIL